MAISFISPEEYCGRLKEMRTSEKVVRLQDCIRESMKTAKKSRSDALTVLDDETAGQSLIVRKALAKKMKLSQVPIGIWDEQLIAGSIALHKEGIMLGGGLPMYATDAEAEEAKKYNLSVWSIVGHIVPDYKRLLRLGIKGIMSAAEHGLAAADAGEKAGFYKAVIISLDGLACYAQRHAELCDSLAEAETNDIRRHELYSLALDLKFSPMNPPETLSQALNTIWLTHAAFQLVGNSLAIGRIDQLMEPYLQRDLAAGRLDLEKAQELFDCFFIKFNERVLDNRVAAQFIDAEKVQAANEKNWAKRSPFAHSTQKFNVRDSVDATNHWLQNVILGGVKPEDGSDAACLSTVMCLESFRRNQMTNPCTTVRLHKNSPEYIVKMVGEVLLTGGGLPAIFNDEAIIPSLIKSGFPLEDSRDYTNDGCWEVLVPGRTDFYFDRFNMLKCLEWALNRGRSRVDGRQEAPDPGDPWEYECFDDVMNSFKRLLDYELEGIISKLDAGFGKRALIAPTPLLSALMEGPVEKGEDMTAGGAKYSTYGLIAEGLSHLIDSLAAIKKVIYEDKRADMGVLIDALNKNFKGYESLRRIMQKAPKYGNNDAYADALGQDIISYFAEKVRELNVKYDKIKYLPGVGTFSWYIAIGEGSGPSPDGRLSCEAVSSNFSPSVNAANKGVTGAVLSHSRMNMTDLPVGSPIDLRISSKVTDGAGGKEKLSGLIRSFIELGGNMLTLTVTDTETLRKAQQEPEKYSTLRVRMGGWSAYFTMLSKEQQEHHINKQEE